HAPERIADQQNASEPGSRCTWPRVGNAAKERRDMRIIGAVTAAMAIASLVAPLSAGAAVQCTLANFYIDSYDHGGTYLHGTLTGPGISTSLAVNMIDICGTTGGTEDCTAKGTDR